MHRGARQGTEVSGMDWMGTKGVTRELGAPRRGTATSPHQPAVPQKSNVGGLYPFVLKKATRNLNFPTESPDF